MSLILFPIYSRHGNGTDDEGRATIYDVISGSNYSLNAVGYKERQIPFPQRNNAVYILKRTESKKTTRQSQ